MDFQIVRNKIITVLEDRWKNEATGHDFFHLQRVVRTAQALQEKEGGDAEKIEIIAWLHDSFDYKIIENQQKEKEFWQDLLDTNGLKNSYIQSIFQTIKEISFIKNKGKAPQLLEGKIVQDADRLDAIGAIGIARAFAYGGSKNRLIYDGFPIPLKQEIPYSESTLAHFYEKLLQLKTLMNTKTAQEWAEERHLFMEKYLLQFYKEWNLESFK